ncbi:hypothetical protein Tco_1305190 [Tanacetum coccineum]
MATKHLDADLSVYQAKPTEKHLIAVKRIFQYLKDSINMGLWYPKDTGGDKLVSWSSKSRTALQYLQQKPSMGLYLRVAHKFYG